jgi:hypothetical protein
MYQADALGLDQVPHLRDRPNASPQISYASRSDYPDPDACILNFPDQRSVV